MASNKIEDFLSRLYYFWKWILQYWTVVHIKTSKVM